MSVRAALVALALVVGSGTAATSACTTKDNGGVITPSPTSAGTATTTR